MEPDDSSQHPVSLTASAALDAVSVLDALHRIALAVGDTSDPGSLAALVGRHARGLLRADDVVLYVWDADASVLRLVYDDNTGHAQLPAIASGQAAIGRAFESGEPVVVADYPNWEGAIPELVERGIKRVAAVPLKIDGHAVGVLAVRFLGAHGCEPAHVQALQLLSAPVAAILETVLARQRAEAGESRLAAIVDHLPCGVAVRDATGRVALLNATGRTMAGVGADGQRQLEQIDNLRMFDPLSGRRLAPEELPTARALKGEHVLDYEVRVKLGDPEAEAWMRISAVPLRGADQAITGAVAIFSDVSKERQLLYKLHASARENRRLVSQLQAVQSRQQELLASLRPADTQRAEGTITTTGLSARERDVLARLRHGETNRQIGVVLGLSPGTVKKHVEHILRKLGVVDRTQAAVRASELGLSTGPD